jgi:pyruvate,orthophosphate dikinase
MRIYCGSSAADDPSRSPTVALKEGRWVIALDGSSEPARSLIGGKASSIVRMLALGLNVPPSFVITTRTCTAFLECGDFPGGLAEEVDEGIAWLEQITGRSFGAGPRPLLVSVRSGAPVSMPGMMDTILNLGINATTEEALGTESRDTNFPRDTHRRFIELYAQTVLQTDATALGGMEDPVSWRNAIAASTGAAVPEDVKAQLHAAIRAVFNSWNSRRARRYRAHHGIAEHLGTAVTVQAMVFGNLDQRSGTGVVFSRNPVTGEPEVFGEFMPCAQGEDLVSGKQTPLPLSAMQQRAPQAFDELFSAARMLERHYGDVQDIEFTVECGRLYLLQTRAAKRAPMAAVRIAIDMVHDGSCDVDAAFSRITSEQVRAILSPRLADGALQDARILARGEPASPGVGVGVIVSDVDEAERRAKAGESVVLARATTSPHDLHGMIAASAVITEQGGSTSHAAVVSRALGRPCVVGCGAESLLGLVGRVVTVDGQAGVVLDGRRELIAPDEDTDAGLKELSEWAAARSSVVVARTPPPGRPIVDLDEFDGAVDLGKLQVFLREIGAGAVVCGGVLVSEAAVALCVAAGVETLVAAPRLPVLLAALRAARTRVADDN